MYDLVIKKGRVVTEEKILDTDIAVEGEKIAAIGEGLTGKREILAEGKLVLPGGIDIHTHMALPVAGTASSDSFYTGTVAAACGGITTIVDFTVGSSDTSLIQNIEERINMAREAVIDYTFHCEIVGWNDQRLREIYESYNKGLRSFKFFTAYGDSGRRTDNGALLEAFNAIASLNGVALIHAEDDDIIRQLERNLSEKEWGKMSSLARTRPDVCEASAISTVSWLARQSRAHVHIVHLSSALGLQEVIQARRLGTCISTETCPQYLFLTESVYDSPEGYLFSASPSLKTKQDNERLWMGLLNGDIDIIATDHCPFTKKQKEWKGSFKKLPYGLPGVETSRVLLFSEGVRKKRISLSNFVHLTAGSPARLMGMYPQKGVLAPGSDADIVIFDQEKKWTLSAGTLHMAVDFSPYENVPVIGKTWCTLSRGTVIVENGEYVDLQRRGHFLQYRETGA